MPGLEPRNFCRRASYEPCVSSSRIGSWDRMQGVVDTSVGYTGGNTTAPTYKSVCRGDGHTEALQVTFDPCVISYEEVMRRVLCEASSHKAKAQYMSAVWTHTPEQDKVANKVAKERKVPLH